MGPAHPAGDPRTRRHVPAARKSSINARGAPPHSLRPGTPPPAALAVASTPARAQGCRSRCGARRLAFLARAAGAQLNTLQTVASPPHATQRFSVQIRRSPRATAEGSIDYGQASRRISIGQLNVSPRLHLRPIDLVIFQEPSGILRSGRSHLVEGFTLRCLQRFSLPDVATRRCRWRDNRYTRGPSIPVLSY